MKNKLLAIFLFVTTILNAQTILTEQLAPAPGDVHTYHNADTTGVWTMATAQSTNWDFNFLQIEDTLRTINYAAIQGTGYDTAFATANLKSTNSSGRNNYFIVNANEFKNIGNAQGSTIIKFTDAFKILTFPFGVGSSLFDYYYSAPFVSGGYPNSANDGFTYTFCNDMGTLQLGNITYNNIILVKDTLFTTYTYPSSPANYVTKQWVKKFSWYDGATKFPMLEYERIRTENSWAAGVIIVTGSVKVREGLLTNVVSNNTTNEKILFDANTRQLTFQNIKNMTAILLYNTNGDIVNKFTIFSDINLSDYSSGLYIVQVQTKDMIINQKVILN